MRLRDIDPPIWRAVQVPEDTKLPRIHRTLQLLFNWEDYHLHQFVVGRRVYSVPDPDDALAGRKVIDARRVPLSRIADRVGDTFEYVYDFGDNWHHLVLLEAILLSAADVSYPRCIAGARNGPPEDAGGARGYRGYLEALADAAHAEHEEKLAWRGPFDAEEFSVEAKNQALSTFQRRSPTKRATSDEQAAHEIEFLTNYMGLLLEGRRTVEIAKTRVAPDTALPLQLSRTAKGTRPEE